MQMIFLVVDKEAVMRKFFCVAILALALGLGVGAAPAQAQDVDQRIRALEDELTRLKTEQARSRPSRSK